ncbi:MAG: PfkB family carbohydrate kinase, partial [Phycisphaeraceae bacterium]|nr:PfkB family carbohydrate kinase [Phycisphaeraceae bacterium]
METIATLTVNPCIDKSASVDVVVADHKVRCQDVRFEPGGGGLNVARVIHELGETAHALYTAGGHPGAMLGELLDDAGLD